MIKNHFKAAFRNVRKEGVVSAINLFGMAAGLTACIIIFLYLSKELSMDKVDAADEIYRMEFVQKSDGAPKWAAIPHYWTDRYAAQFPEIIGFTGIRRRTTRQRIEVQGNIFDEYDVITSNPDILSMFDMNMVGASMPEPLTGRKKVVISKDRAARYFGEEDAVGKFLTINGEDGFLVTGVFELGAPLHIPAELILSVDETVQRGPYYWLVTYLQLQPGANPDQLVERANSVTNELSDTFFTDSEFRLVPMKDIYFGANAEHQFMRYGNKNSIYIFLLIGVMVLTIAAINFVNLSTATFMKRTKEVGVRKVLGASRWQITYRLLIESGIILSVAYGAGFLLVNAVLPQVNQALDLELSLSTLSVEVILIVTAAFMVIGVVSGLFPSLYLNRARLTRVLKSKKGRGTKTVSMMVQFCISTLLIIAMMVVNSQLNYMKEKDLGFGQDRVYMIKVLSRNLQPQVKSLARRFNNHPSVLNSSAMMGAPGDPMLLGNQNAWAEGMPLDENFFLQFYAGDEQVIETLGLNMIEGQSFANGVNVTDNNLGIIINESAKRQFGWEEAVGKRMRISGDEGTVLGVVEDFHFLSLQNQITPTAIVFDYNLYIIAVRIRKGNEQAALEYINEQWKTIDAENPIEGFFLEDSFQEQYAHEERLESLLNLLTILALTISAIGTLGMMMLLIEERIKEISIRKVLGAKMSQILFVLNRKVIFMLVLANAIAWPVAYYFGNQWLSSFAYSTNLSILNFIIGAAVAFVVAFLAISYHSIRAARKNPVETLRYE